MADNIVISAIARVVDLASAPLKAIQKVITGVADTAAKTGGAVAEMGSKVGGAVSGMAGKFGAAAGKVGSFARSMAGLIGPLGGLLGLAGIGGMTAAITDFIAKSKEIAGAAKVLGVSTDSVQVFANVFGDSTERATEAMSQLQKTLVNVGKGGKEIQPTIALFKKMGVSMAEIKAGNLDAILPKIMEGFKQNENPIMRAQAALALFGKSGQDLIPFLIKGKKGFADAVDEMVRLGIVSEDIGKGLKAGQALKDLGNVIDSVKNKIAAEILPAFTGIVEGISAWVSANSALLKQVALPAFIGAIAAAVIGLGIAVMAALGPWTLLAGAIVAAAVAIYQNWDSLIGWLDKEIPGLTSTISKASSDIWSFVKKSASDISKGFQEGGIAGGVQAYITATMAAWSGFGSWIVGIFNSIDWGAVGKAAGALLWQALVVTFQGLVSLGQTIIDAFNAIKWEDVGRMAGTLFIQAWALTFSTLWDINVWLAGLVVKMGQYLSTVNWLEVFKGLMLFWPKLILEMGSIGGQLISGLIKGMIAAIPGMGEVIDGIKAKFKGVGDWFSSIGKGADEKLKGMFAPSSLPSQGGATGGPGPVGPQLQSLLGLSGAADKKSDVSIKSTIIAPPGSSVDTKVDTSGAPINIDKVGGSDFATVAP